MSRPPGHSSGNGPLAAFFIMLVVAAALGVVGYQAGVSAGEKARPCPAVTR